MLKFLFFTFLVLWLAYKIAGFMLRLFFKRAGFTVYTNGRQEAGRTTNPPAPNKAETTRHVTDTLGDYVEYEEVK